MNQELLIHGILVAVALILFVLALVSYARDRHARFRYVCFAFGIFLVRQAYMLWMAATSAGHGIPLVTDVMDIIMVLLFLLAVKS